MCIVYKRNGKIIYTYCINARLHTYVYVYIYNVHTHIHIQYKVELNIRRCLESVDERMRGEQNNLSISICVPMKFPCSISTHEV